jgi:hypothetical protein
MSRRVVIRRAAFVAFFVAWPIAVEWAKGRFPNEAGVHGVPAVASLVVYVACAAALRSRVIAGLLGGVLVWAMTNAFPTLTDMELAAEWWGRLFLWSVIGIVAGYVWDTFRKVEPPDSDEPGTPGTK